MPPEYIIAADLGQVADPTALCVLERRTPNPDALEWSLDTFHRPESAQSHVIHLERLDLGTPYTAIPPRIAAIEERVRQLWWKALCEEAAIQGRPIPGYVTAYDAPIELVLDQTGAGRPVVDLFREAGLNPLAVTITGGDTVSWPGRREARVSKRVLVSTVQAALQAGRVKAASGLPEWTTLRTELRNFRAKISLAGHVSFEAGESEEWRQGTNDDLVLALALGLWAGEYGRSRCPPLSAATLQAFGIDLGDFDE